MHHQTPTVLPLLLSGLCSGKTKMNQSKSADLYIYLELMRIVLKYLLYCAEHAGRSFTQTYSIGYLEPILHKPVCAMLRSSIHTFPRSE